MRHGGDAAGREVVLCCDGLVRRRVVLHEEYMREIGLFGLLLECWHHHFIDDLLKVLGCIHTIARASTVVENDERRLVIPADHAPTP